MHSRLFVLVLLTAAALSSGTVGCNTKNEAQPNPDLKVPDIPPSGKRQLPGEGGKKMDMKPPT
jgi:hypothetical protein